jgi:hypothetical protein
VRTRQQFRGGGNNNVELDELNHNATYSGDGNDNVLDDNKPGLHQTFQKSLVEFLCTDFLIEFLCTDLDGNLSFTLNPLTNSKLDHFLLTLPEGLPETANEDDKECHQHVWHKQGGIALSIR